MNTTWEVITPELAKRYLEHNIGNRPIDMVLVKAFAEDMKNGRWLPTTDDIGFDVNGRCINGQHRLTACVLGGVPFSVGVKRNLPEQSFTVIDKGRRRSLAQTLQLMGLSSAHNIVAIWHMHLYYVNSGDKALNMHIIKTFSDAEKQEQILANNDRLQNTWSKVASAYKKYGLITPGILGGLHFTVSRTMPKQADEFVERLGSGVDLEVNDPILILRNRLTRRADERNKERHEVLMAYYAKVWNAFVTGTPMRQIKWMRSELFPALIR